MKRLTLTVVVVAALATMMACGDTLVDLTEPGEPVPEVPLISGGWQGVVTSSTLPNAVWTMTLTQEAVAASGTWVDDVNLIDGTVTLSVAVDGRVIGSMSLNVRAVAGGLPICTASSTVRGSVAADGNAMDWTADGWPTCAGAPLQTRMDWRRTQ